MARAERIELIQKIEGIRNSRVITFVCSDRRGASAQIADDVVPVIYERVREIGNTDRIDLFLYSQGGQLEVPWRIVSTLREYCNHLGVLVPYKAQSAATLIAIGCDEIIMGPKGELGPIDPALSRINKEGGTAVQEDIRVEDVMSYVGFLTEKAQLTDQAALSQNILLLSQKLSPWVLGSIYRTHSHIRDVAQRMIGSHTETVDNETAEALISKLAEETRSHGHAVTRKEAREMGLPVSDPEPDLETAMWELFKDYESTTEMRRPVDPEAELGDDEEQCEMPLILGWVESTQSTWAFKSTLKLNRTRKTAERYEIQVGLALDLKVEQSPDSQVPNEILATLRGQVEKQLQQQLPLQLQKVPAQVKQLVKDQSPRLGVEGRMVDGYWRDVTQEGV